MKVEELEDKKSLFIDSYIDENIMREYHGEMFAHLDNLLDAFSNYRNKKLIELNQQLTTHALQLIEKNKHLQNYADHTRFCSSKSCTDGICDCGYIKPDKKFKKK